MSDFFLNPVMWILCAGATATLRNIAVRGRSMRFAFGRKLDVLLRMPVKQSWTTIDFRLLLIDNPRFPQAIRERHAGRISYIPLAAPAVEQLPELLRKAVEHTTQFPDQKQMIGRVAHRERSVKGEVIVFSTGDSEFPIDLKVRPWFAMRRRSPRFQLERHQASNLADLMDHGRELSEPIDSNHPGTYR